MPTSETIVSIDIATQLKSALGTACSGITQTTPAGAVSSVTIRVDPDRTRTAPDAVVRPCVSVRVHEAMAHEMVQASKLREYPVTIQAQTDFSDDPGGVCLATMAQAVGRYILAPSTLTLSSATFRRMSLRTEPRRGDADESVDRLQFVVFDVVVGVLVSS